MADAYDYIVVGAGTSGCAVAYRLATESDASVLLIEAGGRDDVPEIYSEQLGDTLSLWANPAVNWGYVTAPQAYLDNREIPVARGKVWGGSSSINAILHVRGNPKDFDTWNYLGNEGWSYQAVLPYFKRLESFAGGDSAYRGHDGPVNVITHDTPSPVSECLFEAASELGFANKGRDFDYNGAEQAGSPFYYQANKKNHQRMSAAVAYLYPILERDNFTVLSHAQVSKLNISGQRVTGVTCVVSGETREIHANQEVIVSAGAYESPKLLMLSGIGAASTLREHGIDVVVDAPGVGQNLQDHMILGVCYLSNHEHPHGPTLISETGLFTHTKDGLEAAAPDLQIKCGGLKFVSPKYDQDGPGFTFAPVLTQPQSVGYVTLRSNNPTDTAYVQPNYLSAEADMQVFVDGVALVRELAHSQAFKEFYKVEIAPGEDAKSEDAVRAFIRENVSTLWHPVGTCKMGHDAMAVVDAHLNVHGLEGVRVADASVMPRIVAGNTNAACYMIGEKAADMILAQA